MTHTPTGPAGESNPTGSNMAVRPTTTVVGSGRGSLVIGLTVTAIAAFAIITAATSIPGGAIRWVAPLALVAAGLIALLRRR